MFFEDQVKLIAHTLRYNVKIPELKFSTKKQLANFVKRQSFARYRALDPNMDFTHNIFFFPKTMFVLAPPLVIIHYII